MTELISKHRKAIDSLRKLASDQHPHFRPDAHDDLFLLRFVLSHPKSAKAQAKALFSALTLRHKHRLDEVAAEVLGTPSRNWRGADGVRGAMRGWAHLVPALLIQPDANGPVAFYVDSGVVDMHALLRDVPRRDFAHASRMMMELIYQRMDRATRSTGFLVKYCRIIDLSGAQLKLVSPRFIRRDAEDNRDFQLLYPQLLSHVIAVNPPASINFLWKTLLPMLPRKVTEKLQILSPNNRRPKDLMQLVRASGIPLEHLPPGVGGCGAAYRPDTTESSPVVAHAALSGREEASARGASAKEQADAWFGAADAAAAREASPGSEPSVSLSGCGAGGPRAAGGRKAEQLNVSEGGALWWSERPLGPRRRYLPFE